MKFKTDCPVDYGVGFLLCFISGFFVCLFLRHIKLKCQVSGRDPLTVSVNTSERRGDPSWYPLARPVAQAYLVVHGLRATGTITPRILLLAAGDRYTSRTR